MDADNPGQPLLTPEVERVRRRRLVVEPVVFLYALSDAPLGYLRTRLLYNKVAQHMGVNLSHLAVSNATNHCDVNMTDPSYVLREHVQAESAQWTLYLFLSGFLPFIIMNLFFGAYSDKRGRRITFVLPPIGAILAALVDLAVICFDLPVYVLLFEHLECFFGGFYTMFAGAISYISDTCRPEKRAFRLTLLDIVFLITKAVFTLACGYWIRSQGMIWPYVFVIAGKLLTLFYSFFFVPETVDVTKNSARGRPGLWRCVVDSLKLYVKNDAKGRRIKVFLVVGSYVVMDFLSPYGVMNLFLMNTPFCMESVALGYFDFVTHIARCFAMVIAVPLMARCLSEPWIAVIGRLSYIAEFIFLAMSTTIVMAVMAPVLGCVSLLAVPMIRAISSGLVLPSEQGALFASMSVLSRIALLVSMFGTTRIYRKTLFFLPGTVFICSSFCAAISICMLLVYIYRQKRFRVSDPSPAGHIQ